MNLLDQEDARALIYDRVNSGEWWLIVGGDTDLPQLVEERYYDGERNKFFQLMISPHPVMSIVFARKREMSARQFAECVRELGGRIPTGDLDQQDILFPDSDPAQAFETAQALAKFLGVGRPPTDAVNRFRDAR